MFDKYVSNAFVLVIVNYSVPYKHTVYALLVVVVLFIIHLLCTSLNEIRVNIYIYIYINHGESLETIVEHDKYIS